MTTKDLVIPPGFAFDLSTEARRTFAELLMTFPILDPADIEDRSLIAELHAESAEDLFAAPETRPLDGMTGEPFWLTGVVGVLPSEVREHVGEPYVLLSARDDNARAFTISTGSHYSMRRAVKAAAAGMLPRRVMAIFLQSKGDTSRSSLWIVDAPKPTGPVTEATARPVVDDEHF